MLTNYRLYLKYTLQVSTKTGMKSLFANCFRSDFVVLLMKTVYLIVLRLMKFVVSLAYSGFLDPLKHLMDINGS